jgi:leader peptidase (prepilin peptidase) / N-methyltransferase
MALVGLLAGSAIAFLSPRLVAYRLETQPVAPSTPMFVPVAGPWLAHVSPLRPLVLEGIAAAVLAALAAHFGWTLKLAIASIYAGLLLTVAYIDINHRLVLNRLTYPGTLMAIILSLGWTSFSTYLHPLNALLGALLGLLMFGALQILGRGAMGMGDTKLAILIGAMVGFPNVLSTLLLGVLLGGLGALFFLVVLRRGRKTYMAYAPYLVAGAILYFFAT